MSYHANLKQLAADNQNFRAVLHTTKHSQLVVMRIPPGEEIGEETHDHVEQVLYFHGGTGEAILNDVSSPITPGDGVIVPAGTKHNFINTGTEDLVITTVYLPPNHPDGTVHKTKAEADADEIDAAFGHAV